MLMHRQEALKELTGQYGLTHPQAIRALEIAFQNGVNSEGCGTSAVTITFIKNGKEQYNVEDGLPAIPVAKEGRRRYTSGKAQTTVPKEDTMPRGKQAEVKTEAETNGERDLAGYLTKDLTPTMVDYMTWLRDTFGDLDKLDSERLAFISVTVYPEFQKSDFNIEQRAARREAREKEAQDRAAARESAKADEKAEDETPRRGRGRPKGTTGGTTGPRSSSPATPRRGRGRPAGASKETAGAAPY